jgi:hypothetical protein
MRFSLRYWYSVICALLLAAGLLGAESARAQSLQVLTPETGSGISRLRKLTYTNTDLGSNASGSFLYEAPNILLCTTAGAQPRGVRRVLLTAKFSANTVVDPGAGASSVELHNMGTKEFRGKVSLLLSGDGGPAPYNSPIELTINKDKPEQSFVLDLTSYFTAAILPGTSSRLTAAIVPGSYTTANPNFRLTILLEESYDFPPPAVTLIQPVITRTDGLLEQELNWTTSCVTENYQIQLLKLTREEASGTTTFAATEADWRQRATTLDVQTREGKWQTTLAEGYGVYYYRIRALGGAPGGVTNPENWGAWSPGVGLITLSAGPAASLNLANLNWIYSRTFTEGGHVAEKITYANSAGFHTTSHRPADFAGLRRPRRAAIAAHPSPGRRPDP